jgi:hypothetical protein
MPAIHSRSQDAWTGLDSFASFTLLLATTFGAYEDKSRPYPPEPKRSYKPDRRSIYQFWTSAAALQEEQPGTVLIWATTTFTLARC